MPQILCSSILLLILIWFKQLGTFKMMLMSYSFRISRANPSICLFVCLLLLSATIIYNYCVHLLGCWALLSAIVHSGDNFPFFSFAKSWTPQQHIINNHQRADEQERCCFYSTLLNTYIYIYVYKYSELTICFILSALNGGAINVILAISRFNLHLICAGWLKPFTGFEYANQITMLCFSGRTLCYNRMANSSHSISVFRCAKMRINSMEFIEKTNCVLQMPTDDDD